MDKYFYVAQRKKGGAFERGFIGAGSVREAERELMAKNLPVLVLERVKEHRKSKSEGVRRQAVPKISLKELLFFSRNMEQCQEIDMGLLIALDICREMALTKKFGDVIAKIRHDVSEGATLHDAMANTLVFDQLVLGLVKAGEKSGFLNKAFAQIKHNYARTTAIKRKVIKLLSYPLVVMFVAALCIFFLMWKTVPTFVGLFSTAGLVLPLPTRILMAVSSFTTTYPYLVLAGIVGAGFLVVKLPVFYRKVPRLHGAVLRLPLFGKFQKMLIRETFTRTFLNLQLAGLKIIDSLALCRQVSTCYPYKGAIARAMVSVSSGSGLMAALEVEKDIFGVIVVRTIGFGEKSGKTEKVLEPLAETLSVDIMDFIDTLNTIIEPLLTLFIGSIVLLVMLAMFIPIFSLPKLL